MYNLVIHVAVAKWIVGVWPFYINTLSMDDIYGQQVNTVVNPHR